MHGIPLDGERSTHTYQNHTYHSHTRPQATSHSQTEARSTANRRQHASHYQTDNVSDPAGRITGRGHSTKQSSASSDLSPSRSTVPSGSSLASGISQSPLGSPTSLASSASRHIHNAKYQASNGAALAVPPESLVQYSSPAPSIMSSRSPSSSAYHSPLMLQDAHIAPASSPLHRRIERELPPLPPPEPFTESAASSPYSLRRGLPPSHSPSIRTVPSASSHDVDSPRQISRHLGRHPADRFYDPSSSTGDHNLNVPASHQSRMRMNSAGMAEGFKKLGKASASAWKSAQQKKWYRQGSAQSQDPDSPTVQRHDSLGEDGHSTGNKKQNWARGLGNLRELSANASKSTSALAAGARRRIEEDSMASWDSSRLKVPKHPKSPTSRTSSTSSAVSGPAHFSTSPGPIASPDPSIGLPFQVQHNVHVDVGPDGYRGLPASWARYLAEKNEGADEDDPRLQLESRIGFRKDDDNDINGHFNGDDDDDDGSDTWDRQKEALRASVLAGGSTRHQSAFRDDASGHDGDQEDWHHYNQSRQHLSTLSIADDSSGKRTARPSMAPSRASTSYSSVLNTGWDEWSENGATPPPPVPPLPLPMQSPRRRLSDISPRTNSQLYDEDHDDSTPRESGDESGQGRMRKAEQNGLGLGLTGFDAVASTLKAGSEKSPMLPEFLSGGGKEDEDWAMMLLNSIPAESEDPSAHGAKASSDRHPSRASRRSSARTAKSRSKSVDPHSTTRSPSRASQKGNRDLLSSRASFASKKAKSTLQPSLPPPSPRPSVPASENRPSSRASKKGASSRAASRRTTRTLKTPGAEWSESEEDDEDYTGGEDSDVQISTAKTESLGKVTAPRALTHSQFVDTVRSSPGTNSEGGSFHSPTLSPPLSVGRGSRNETIASRREADNRSTGSQGGRRPQVPRLQIDSHLAEQTYQRQYGTAVVVATDHADSQEGSQPKSGWSHGSTSPKPSTPGLQPTTPGGSLSRGFANLKMGSLAANAKKVAAAAAASVGPSNQGHSLFHLKSSAASRSTPTLTKRYDVSGRPEERMPTSSEHVKDSGEGRKQGPSSPSLSPGGTSPSMPAGHILGLRERRKMNGPARIYPPNASQTGKIRNYTHQNNLPDSDSGHVGSSDAGSVANTSLAGRTESNSSIAGGQLKSKGSNSSLAGHLRKGSIRGFFRRESQDQDRKAAPSGRESEGGSSASHSLNENTGYYQARASSRNRSGSSAGHQHGEPAPKVPPKDLVHPSTWNHTPPPRPAAIGIIRPDANGFFSVPSSAQSHSHASLEMLSPSTGSHTISVGHSGRSHRQGSGSGSTSAAHSAPRSPEHQVRDWEDERGYGANEFLEQWMDDHGQLSARARSPGGYSNVSGSSNSRSTRKPSKGSQLGPPSPGYAEIRDTDRLSPSANSFGRGGEHSPSNSPRSYGEKALPKASNATSKDNRRQNNKGVDLPDQISAVSRNAPLAVPNESLSSSRVRSVPGLEHWATRLKP
ncbi:unnamed protein product [Sympodiomycopsis kandeliae]